MNWFEYVTGRDAEGVMHHIDIMRSARRRRVFSTDNPQIVKKCLTLKGAGLMAGAPEDGFRLTRNGHQLLKEQP